MKESNENHLAEKDKIKEKFNKNKENFLKQKENNDNLRLEVEELLITIEDKNSEIEVFKQEVKSKEDNINDLKKQIRKYTKMYEEIVNYFTNPRESKLSCDKCGESFKMAGLLRRYKKLFHETKSS